MIRSAKTPPWMKELLADQKTRQADKGLKKKSKYRNIKCEGYDSLKEKRRATELKQQLRAGLISDLIEQPEFVLIPKQTGERAVKYLADFQYRDSAGEIVVEDVKSPITAKNPVYVIKRKLMLYVHGIKITQV